jgi:hypothetical protein
VMKKTMWVCVAAHQVRLPHTNSSSEISLDNNLKKCIRIK